MAGPVKVKLKDPIPWGKGNLIEEIEIRPPSAKDFRKLPMIDGLEMDTTLLLAERLSGLPAEAIDKLTGDDLAEVVAVVTGFMPRFRATGSASSGT